MKAYLLNQKRGKISNGAKITNIEVLAKTRRGYLSDSIHLARNAAVSDNAARSMLLLPPSVSPQCYLSKYFIRMKQYLILRLLVYLEQQEETTPAELPMLKHMRACTARKRHSKVT
ncbi:hypothetical protein J6590_026434 [Homalodisca vitripennis]|nr:hypothetical protein J6590_026434 [Homalodisca vitripennis]